MIYVSNVQCECGNFLLATTIGLVCPHCATQFTQDMLHTMGDYVEVSVSAEKSWYDEYKDKFKEFGIADFIGFDPFRIDGGKINVGFVDFGFGNPTHKNIVRLVEKLDETYDKNRVWPLDPS